MNKPLPRKKEVGLGTRTGCEGVFIDIQSLVKSLGETRGLCIEFASLQKVQKRKGRKGKMTLVGTEDRALPVGGYGARP